MSIVAFIMDQKSTFLLVLASWTFFQMQLLYFWLILLKYSWLNSCHWNKNTSIIIHCPLYRFFRLCNVDIHFAVNKHEAKMCLYVHCAVFLRGVSGSHAMWSVYVPWNSQFLPKNTIVTTSGVCLPHQALQSHQLDAKLWFEWVQGANVQDIYQELIISFIYDSV